MNVLELKDALSNPLKKAVEQYKTPAISQFKSLDDIKILWSRAEGLEMAILHIDNTYKALTESQAKESQAIEGELVQEVLPPHKG